MSPVEKDQLPLSVEEAISAFAAADELAQSIQDQNDRHQRAGVELTDPDFRDIAVRSIAEEQEETLDLLKEATEVAPYGLLGSELLRTEKEVRSTEEAIAELEAKISSQQVAIDQQTRQAILLAPHSKADFEELAAIKKQRVIDSNQQVIALRQDLKDLQDYSGDLEIMFEESSGAWHIPFVKRAPQRDTIEIIDEIPVEPTVVDHSQDEERIRGAYSIDAPDASALLVDYLSQNRDEIVDVETLIMYLYRKNPRRDSEEERKYRSRVTTLLGPAKAGMAISNILAAQGLILQYGWRREKVTHPDGAAELTLPRRIYRASRADEVVTDEEENIEENESEIIIWQPLPQSRRESHEQVGKRAIAKLVVEVSGEEGTAPETPQALVVETPGPLAQEARWVPAFKKDVADAIAALSDQHLIHKEVMSAKNLAHYSNSRKMGTNESLNRLKRAGIIGHETLESGELNAVEIVAMYLLNTHSQTLSRKRTRKAALAIIEESVETFLATQ